MAKHLLPDYVKNKDARREFVRVVNEIGMDKLRPVDISLLLEYAIMHGDIIELMDEVRVEGYMLVSAKGGAYVNPKQNVLSSKQAHLAQLRRDLYFTPRSRVEKGRLNGKAQGILEALQEMASKGDDEDED